MSQIHTVEAVTAALRTGNEGKMAALGAMAHASRVAATIGRMDEYVAAFKHAHETGNIEEAQGLAIALSRAAITLNTATTDLDNALTREMAAQRAVAA